MYFPEGIDVFWGCLFCRYSDLLHQRNPPHNDLRSYRPISFHPFFHCDQQGFQFSIQQAMDPVETDVEVAHGHADERFV